VYITSVIEEKVAAIGCYESEMNQAFMQLDAILVLSRF
jgi:N-acetylglucosamine malate deacetylase 1